MSRHQEILFNLAGQSFQFDPLEGQPSGTPTVQVFRAETDDTGTAELATSGPCVVDSVGTTIGAAVDPGVTAFSVASATGIAIGRRYRLANPAGEVEWVEVVGLASTAVQVRQPIKNAQTTASSFQGCRVSIGVNSAWAADLGKISERSAGFAGYRLRWAYTVDSIACLGVSYADLVRYSAKSLVTPLDVDRRFPGWIDSLPSDYQEDQGAALINEAFQACRMDALGDEQVLRRIRNAEILRELVVLRANVIARENAVLMRGGSLDAVGLARELYDRRYAQLLREPKVPVDNAGAGAGGQAVRLPMWRR